MLLQGDEAKVPVGDEGAMSFATIVNIQVVDAKDIKCPINQIKKIIELHKRHNN